MRIVINGPPKQGHRWLKCLLSNVYDLDVLGGKRKPVTRTAAVREWVKGGGFPDGTIYHQHSRYSPRLVEALEAAPAHLVTVLRNPYDTFVSYYYWAQDRAENDDTAEAQKRRRYRIVGKPLDDPEVLGYLTDHFGVSLKHAQEWLESGHAIPVRYEGLHHDPVAEVRRVTDLIAPVPTERIEAAVTACSAENMRQMSAKMSRHVRAGTVGDSKQRLTDAHLAIFRDRHAPLIRSLGYEVR